MVEIIIVFIIPNMVEIIIVFIIPTRIIGTGVASNYAKQMENMSITVVTFS